MLTCHPKRINLNGRTCVNALSGIHPLRGCIYRKRTDVLLATLRQAAFSVLTLHLCQGLLRALELQAVDLTVSAIKEEKRSLLGKLRQVASYLDAAALQADIPCTATKAVDLAELAGREALSAREAEASSNMF